MTLTVFGNQEVFNRAQSLEIEGNIFKIYTLPGLCILKLIPGHEKADRTRHKHNTEHCEECAEACLRCVGECRKMGLSTA